MLIHKLQLKNCKTQTKIDKINILISLTHVKLPMYNWYRRPVVELLLEELLVDEPFVTNAVLFWLFALGGLSTGCLV